MNNVNNDGRPHFFPNSRTAQDARAKKRMEALRRQQELERIQGNTNERRSELKNIQKEDVKLSIPDRVKDFSKIKSMVDRAPEIDNSQKIAQLKSQIRNNEYKVNYDKLADKLLEQEF